MAEFAVLGQPIDHSLSPELHTAAAASLQLEGFHYGRFDVGEDELEEFLDTHPALVGLSLTMPLKHRLMEIGRTRGWTLDETAELTGAGNTLLRPATGVPEILNTDVQGIVDAVHEALAEASAVAVPWTGEADVLGAGATASSALTAAASLGVAHVRLFVRNRNRAAGARHVADSLGLTSEVCDLPDWVPGERGLTLSTLPAGSLTAESLPLRDRIDAVIFDAAYAEAAAPVHRALRSRGALVVDGGRMLLHQAVAQHVRFAQLAGLTAAEAEASRDRIRSAMDDVLP